MNPQPSMHHNIYKQ